MKPRSCRIVIRISNNKSEQNNYCLRPLGPAELGQSVAGFRLENLTQPPHAVYAVRLAVDGQVTCNCPQHPFGGECKHADALVAAGLLPSALLGMIQERTKQLDAADAEAMHVAADAVHQANSITNLIATVANLKERCECLQQTLDEYQTEMVRMEKPKTRRRRQPVAKAA